jgi:iron(III) transport system substrate-binding protein
MRKPLFLAMIAALSTPLWAQETTPAMVAAAEKEGKVVWYASVDVKVAEEVAKMFKAQYPKIEVEVERSGPSVQRINQEYQSNIHRGRGELPPMRRTSSRKQQKWLAKHSTPDVAKFAAQYKDADGYFATWRASLSCMAYNTNIVKEADAPKGYKDLLDPKWKGKLTKAHPGYSGTALTGTYALEKLLGWGYFEQLAKQGVQQLQSTTATPKSIASGERAVMVDGNEYNVFIEMKAKSPVKPIYAVEGTPFISSPTAIFEQAPHPNAARVFQNFIYTAKVQQMIVDVGGQRSAHPEAKEPADRTPLSKIKLLPDDPAGMMPQVAEIKKKYTAIFGN